MKGLVLSVCLLVLGFALGERLGEWRVRPRGIVNLGIPGHAVSASGGRAIVISHRGNSFRVNCASTCPDVGAHMEIRDNHYDVAIYGADGTCIDCRDMYVDGGFTFNERLTPSSRPNAQDRIVR